MNENLQNSNHFKRLQDEMNRFEAEIGVAQGGHFRPPFLLPSFFPPPPPPLVIFQPTISSMFVPQQVQKHLIKKEFVPKDLPDIYKIVSKEDNCLDQQVVVQIKEDNSPVISATAHLYSHLTPLVLTSPPKSELHAEQKAKKLTKKLKKLKFSKSNKIKKYKPMKNKEETTVNNNNTNTNTDTTIKEERKIIRKAGGQIWEDKTLLDWEEDDFRLFCGDLGNDVTDDLLKWTFSKYPSFIKAKVIRDKRTNKTKGYGFVSFKNAQDYINAMKEINGRYVGSRPIKLRKSTYRSRNIDLVQNKEKERKYFLS